MPSSIIVVKHFPTEFSDQQKEDFLKDCGAIETKILSSRRNKYNLAFAKFPSVGHATEALRHLHQQQVLGRILCAEYAKFKDMPESSPNSDSARVKPCEEGGSEAVLKRFVEKLSQWMCGSDVRVPVPAHLRYQYPPPTATTLRNILHLLQANPRLYTQVLHLINKMNLPCPISEDVMEPPLPPVPVPFRTEQSVSPSESSESELSSDNEGAQHRETIPTMSKKQKKPLKPRKLAKIVEVTKSTSRKATFEEVFQDPKTLLADAPKKKKLKVTKLGTVNDGLQKQIEGNLTHGFGQIGPKSETGAKGSEHPEAPGFGVIHPIRSKTPEKTVEDVRDPREEERLEKREVKCITAEQIAANRINAKDRTLLPVFKNYAEGPATCRLYVKNLAKKTSEEDLRFIYTRYLQPTSEGPDIFDIRLMQEGRMKGQAFVTLSSVELATQALKETNGYILNDKPMVVQFARSAVK